MTLTAQQQNIIDAISKYSVILIDALAGTGKTTTLQLIVSAFPELKKLYLVFDKANQLNAIKKFQGTNCEALTTHSLAYKAVVQHTSIDLSTCRNNYKAKEISDFYSISFPVAQKAVNIFELYCNSDSEDFGPWEELGNTWAFRLFSDMQLGILAPTHSFYLKMFHILLCEEKLTFDFDLAMIDECQDTNMVTLDIFKRMNIKTKIFVGDDNQQIYGFRGSDNIMKHVNGARFPLTETFRCPQNLCTNANILLEKFKNAQDLIVSNVPVSTEIDTSAFISRTNSALIGEIKRCIDNGITFKTIRRPNQIFSVPLDLLKIKNGLKSTITANTYLKKFKSFEDIESFAKETNDVELITACKIVSEHHLLLPTLYAQAETYFDSNLPITYFLTSAHGAKGLEWDSVVINNDFGSFIKLLGESTFLTIDAFRKNIRVVDSVIVNEFNLFYVALTRAKKECFVNSTNLEFLTMSDTEINIQIKDYLIKKSAREKNKK